MGSLGLPTDRGRVVRHVPEGLLGCVLLDLTPKAPVGPVFRALHPHPVVSRQHPFLPQTPSPKAPVAPDPSSELWHLQEASTGRGEGAPQDGQGQGSGQRRC